MTLEKQNKDNFFDSSLKAGLYVITCKSKQKHYIGQSKYVTPRLNAHKSKLRRGCHENIDMQKDFNEFGENCFLFQKLYFGIGSSKIEREHFETLILLTLHCLVIIVIIFIAIGENERPKQTLFTERNILPKPEKLKELQNLVKNPFLLVMNKAMW